MMMVLMVDIDGGLTKHGEMSKKKKKLKLQARVIIERCGVSKQDSEEDEAGLWVCFLFGLLRSCSCLIISTFSFFHFFAVCVYVCDFRALA